MMRLAFYKGRTTENPAARLFDEAVCLWTRGPYSHVELVVGGTDKAAVCWSISYRDGISKAELASRVIAKADLFAQLSGAIIGKRQGLEDQIDAISDGLTPEELEAPITPAVQALLDAVQWDAP